MTSHNPDFTQPAHHQLDDDESSAVEDAPIKQRITELVFNGYHRAAPLLYKSSYILREQAMKIHQRGNWRKRCSKTLFSNSVSLAMGMLAAHIVENSVEISQFSNLWGLLASKPTVSESTYQVINFFVKFGITVLVFTLTEHFISEYRQRKSATE